MKVTAQTDENREKKSEALNTLQQSGKLVKV